MIHLYHFLSMKNSHMVTHSLLSSSAEQNLKNVNKMSSNYVVVNMMSILSYIENALIITAITNQPPTFSAHLKWNPKISETEFISYLSLRTASFLNNSLRSSAEARELIKYRNCCVCVACCILKQEPSSFITAETASWSVLSLPSQSMLWLCRWK